MDGTQLSELQQDALALLCNAQFELNCIRKDGIRPEINPKYAQLCKACNVQSAKYIFGEDLSNQVKTLQEEFKAAVGVVKTPSVVRLATTGMHIIPSKLAAETTTLRLVGAPGQHN